MITKKTIISILGTIVFLLLPVIASSAQTIEAKVAKVMDGDTIRLEYQGSVPGVKRYKDGTVAVRLRGVDARELSQPYGRESKSQLEGQALGKIVRVQVMDIDRYGRIVGYVYVNGLNVNLEQIRNGYAWAYTEYLDRPYASEFYEAEKEAEVKSWACGETQIQYHRGSTGRGKDGESLLRTSVFYRGAEAPQEEVPWALAPPA